MIGSMQRLEFSTTMSPNPVPAQRRAEILAEPGFGLSFTDHMVTATWTPDDGWHEGAVQQPCQQPESVFRLCVGQSFSSAWRQL